MAAVEVPDAQWPVYLNKKCAICEVNEITFRCLNCEELLCNNCKKMHLKSKIAKHHKVVCLETAEIYQSSETKTKCPTHMTEDLLMYCGTCKCPICRDCIASALHLQHQMVKIENVIDNKQRELTKLIRQSKEISSNYDDVVKTIDKNIREFSLAVSQKIEQVKARNNQLKCKLDKHESDCIRQLKDADDKNKTAMTELKQRLQGEIKDLKYLLQQCEVKQRNRNIEMIEFVTEITQRLDKYKSYDKPDTTSPPNLITRNVDDREIKNLFGYLDTLTTTHVQPLLLQKRNIPSASTVIDFKILNSFTTTNNRIVTVDHDQAWLWRFGDKGISLVTSDGKVIQKINTDFPLHGVAVSASGDLLLTVWGGHEVKRLKTDNTFTDIYTTDTDNKTRCITVTDTGNVLVGLYNTKYNNSKVVEITSSGQQIRTIQHDTVDNKLLFNSPVSICTNIKGDIVVVDDFSSIVSVNRFGTKRFIYDGKDRNLKKSFYIQCVVTDKYGNIMITDCSSSVVRMINQDGKFLQYLITREQGCDAPRGMSIDNAGRLWVCNVRNNEVFIVKYL